MKDPPGYTKGLLYTWRGLALLALIGVVVVYRDRDEMVWLLVWSVFSMWLADGDIRTRLMPRRVIYVGIGFTLAAMMVTILVTDHGWTPSRDGIIGGLSAFVALLVMRVLSSGAIGGGDVRLAALLGLGVSTVMGPFGGLVAVAAGWLLHGAIALTGLAKRLLTMESTLPLGPSLVLASMACVVVVALL
ncbi:MAG: hypothetical protein GEU79_07850 [Acidimicrobiia bacterium]|nr:hypothetical protein [Acidimicrobiia bacterium]